jgi:hypothetical protein
LAEEPFRSEEPVDRLTTLCDAMTTALKVQEGFSEDVKAVVMLQDDKRGGIQLFNYEDETEAMVDLFMHLRAIFRAQGKDLMFAPINQG